MEMSDVLLQFLTRFLCTDEHGGLCLNPRPKWPDARIL